MKDTIKFVAKGVVDDYASLKDAEEKQYDEWRKKVEAAGPVKRRFMEVGEALNTPLLIPCLLGVGIPVVLIVKEIVNAIF